MGFDRIDRVSEAIKRELAGIIRELKDPRISEFVSIVAVKVTKDFKYAKVYVSVLGTDEQKQASIKGLSGAAGFIRREIGQRVQLRYTPEFTFVLDDSIEYGAHISKVLSDIENKR